MQQPFTFIGSIRKLLDILVRHKCGGVIKEQHLIVVRNIYKLFIGYLDISQVNHGYLAVMLGHKGGKAVCVAVLEHKELSALMTCAYGYHRLICAEECAVFILYVQIFTEVHSVVYGRLLAKRGVYLDLGLCLIFRQVPDVDSIGLYAVVQHL